MTAYTTESALGEKQPIGDILSSDSHVIEPPDLWTARAGRRWEGHVPHVVDHDGADWWVIDGELAFSFAGGAQVGERHRDKSKLKATARFSDVAAGAFEPDAFVADNLSDGVVGAVVYPTNALLVYRTGDSALFSKLCEDYNQWLAAFCAAHPERLKGVAMINVDDPAAGPDQLEAARSLGLAGAMLPVEISDPGYGDDRFQPLWSAAEDLAMPLSMHLGSNRRRPGWSAGSFRRLTEADIVNFDYYVRRSLAQMIFGGVFERHPGLRVGAVEHEASWVPHFLERMDYLYEERTHRPGWHRFADQALPSDFFHRNVFVSFQEDPVALRLIDLIGAGTLTFGNDYPHTESTFPFSRERLQTLLSGLSPTDRALIVHDTTAKLYGFDHLRTAGGHG